MGVAATGAGKTEIFCDIIRRTQPARALVLAHRTELVAQAVNRLRDFGIDVFQFEGGILNYFQQMPDAEHDWNGECFVFDNRIALDTRLQETATTAEVVFDVPEDAWRLARAQRLDAAE